MDGPNLWRNPLLLISFPSCGSVGRPTYGAGGGRLSQ